MTSTADAAALEAGDSAAAVETEEGAAEELAEPPQPVRATAASIGSQSVGQITAGIASELDAKSYLMLLGNTELDRDGRTARRTAG